MPRPETIEDIEPGTVTVAVVHLDSISTDPVLLKGYTDLLTAMVRGGATVDTRYQQVTFARAKSPAELADQLKTDQAVWDSKQEYYEKWARGEEFAYEYQLNEAKRHAQVEGLPMFTWEASGQRDLNEVLDDIDDLVES